MLLFYFVKNPLDDTYITKCQLPLETQQSIPFEAYTFTSLPALHCIPLSHDLLLLFTDTQIHHILLLDQQHHITPLPTQDTISEHQRELSQVSANFQKSIQKRDQLIESIKGQYAELMNTATRYREEAIKWHQKYMDATSF